MGLQVAPLSSARRQVKLSGWSIEGPFDKVRVNPSSQTPGMMVTYAHLFTFYFIKLYGLPCSVSKRVRMRPLFHPLPFYVIQNASEFLHML